MLAGRACYVSPDSRVTDEGAQQPHIAARQSTRAGFLVRIELDADEVGGGELWGRVKLGLGGTAEIVTSRESILGILLKRVRQTISSG